MNVKRFLAAVLAAALSLSLMVLPAGAAPGSFSDITDQGDISGAAAQRFPPYGAVEVFYLLLRPPIVPENGGAEYRAILVQGHQAVHLPARADAPHLGSIVALQKRGNALQNRVPPVLRILLAPAGAGELDGVFPAGYVQDLTTLPHQQELYR